MTALMEQGWAVVDDFVDPPLAEALMALFRIRDGEGRFRPATIGRADDNQLNRAIRGDRIAWIEDDESSPALRQYLDQLEVLRQQVNRHLYLGLFELEAHLAIYEPGSYYQRHMDNFRGQQERTLTAVLYLNPHWQPGDGGEIRLYLDEEEGGEFIDVAPRAGRLALFLSDRFPHEVLTTQRERLSITGWFRTRENG